MTILARPRCPVGNYLTDIAARLRVLAMPGGGQGGASQAGSRMTEQQQRWPGWQRMHRLF